MTPSEIQSVQAKLTANAAKIHTVHIGYTDGTGDTFDAKPVTPPPPLVIPQAPGAWFKDVGGSKDLSIADTAITDGGLVHFISSGRLAVKRCASLGAPAGKGMYFIIVATGGCKEFLWDNTGLKDAWIFHGNEAALRVMGGCKKATVTNVDFCGRMHRDGKLLAIPSMNAAGVRHPAGLNDAGVDWWKQAVQWRDVKEALWQGGRCIGRWDVGQQENNLTPQRVEKLLVEGVGLTDEPHFTDPKSYGTVERHDCYKIDLSGKALTKGGQLVKWEDKTWRGQ